MPPRLVDPISRGRNTTFRSHNIRPSLQQIRRDPDRNLLHQPWQLARDGDLRGGITCQKDLKSATSIIRSLPTRTQCGLRLHHIGLCHIDIDRLGNACVPASPPVRLVLRSPRSTTHSRPRPRVRRISRHSRQREYDPTRRAPRTLQDPHVSSYDSSRPRPDRICLLRRPRLWLVSTHFRPETQADATAQVAPALPKATSSAQRPPQPPRSIDHRQTL